MFVCYANDSHELFSLIFSQNLEKYFKMPSATVLFDAFRVKYAVLHGGTKRKGVLETCVDSEGPGQTAQSCNLIRAFAVLPQDRGYSGE